MYRVLTPYSLLPTTPYSLLPNYSYYSLLPNYSLLTLYHLINPNILLFTKTALCTLEAGNYHLGPGLHDIPRDGNL
jgi:hypothetical protein